MKNTAICLTFALALSGCGTGAMNILTAPSGWFNGLGTGNDTATNDPMMIELEDATTRNATHPVTSPQF